MLSEGIGTQVKSGVVVVTIDRPPANAIDAKTSRIMGNIFSEFRDNPSLRVAVVTGSGERFFSAGWDLKAAAEGEPADSDFGVGGFGGLQELTGLNKPVIAAINGMAIGGGFELALSADLILATDHAQFSLPELKVGQLADAGSIKLPRRVPHHIALEMLLTGRWMAASEAKQWGLVNEVTSRANLLSRAVEIAKSLTEASAFATAATKEVVRETDRLGWVDAIQLVRGKSLSAVRALYASQDIKEGPKAFAEKRKPMWQEC